ncbi:MAG: tRNA (adenosine(37)-N6)-dimethylallyltransferase MiaA [Clostridia bacterium]|nr:tRNA (adenosine(37)-N6)-dimethylallyltransferase MiaA [Clostridia bacterium]
MERPILPVVAGPTASGKTACAVELAILLGGEVVSADSMQIYRGMDILSAKPTKNEMKGVKHHLMGFVDPRERYTADAYRADAKQVIAEIADAGKMPVMCGGTGLYINAVTRPMSFSEQSDERMHEELMAMGNTPHGRKALHDMLAEIDPESAARLHENDVRRVSRAIEIFRLTGKTQTEQIRLDKEREGDFREIIFAPDWPRDELYSRIGKRVDMMMKAGLVEEVRSLLKDAEKHPTALQAIGYKEIAAALRGEISMSDAVEWTKQATRHLAKKQLTWFKRDERVIWIDAAGKSAAQMARNMHDIIRARFSIEI